MCSIKSLIHSSLADYLIFMLFRLLFLQFSGNCSFEQKVRNAQAAGYNAVIVHNVGSEELGNLKNLLFFVRLYKFISVEHNR